jgi:hypothetical protein
MNAVDDKLLFPLTCIGEFNHANHGTSAIKMVKKLAFQLFLTVVTHFSIIPQNYIFFFPE